MKLNSRVLLIFTLVMIMFTTVTYANKSNIIVTPSVLEGEIGAEIPTNNIYVQEVTLNSARMLDVYVVNSDGKILTKFPKKSGRYLLMDKATRKSVGFIDLQSKKTPVIVSTSDNYKGEFLFYQNGSVFNNISNAVDGDLYFFRTNPKSSSLRPMILDIGTIENGILNYRDYIVLDKQVLKLKR